MNGAGDPNQSKDNVRCGTVISDTQGVSEPHAAPWLEGQTIPSNETNSESDDDVNSEPVITVPVPARGLDGQTPAPWLEVQTIPTVCGHRPPPGTGPMRPLPVRQEIRRNNRLVTASSLPSFSAPNCRSLGPKLRSFAEDMKLREVDVALCSETWEKANNVAFQNEVERLLEIQGLKMISQARKYKRGGGVCILADLTKVSIQPLEVPNPFNLEVVFALVKPRKNAVIKEIITFAFYSPPRSRTKSKLVDHIVTNLQALMTSFPRAGVMGGGDRNCLNLAPILAAIPHLLNIQPLPTHGRKNLDVLLSTMGQYYAQPLVFQPVGTDDPNQGVPSDHMVPVVYPMVAESMQKPKMVTTKTTRPLPDSAIKDFAKIIINEDWTDIKESESPDEQANALQNKLFEILNKTCPTKTVKLRLHDKPFITKELKDMDKKRKKEYKKHGKTNKYAKLNADYNNKFKAESKKYLNKNVDSLKESNPGQAYLTLKRLAGQPGECLEGGSLDVASHEGLTVAESADRLANHFSAISQEFPPLLIENLPPHVQESINNRKNSEFPYISRQSVEAKIQKAKNTKGGVPSDIPVRLMKEFSPEIALPVAQLFRKIAKTGQWPKNWKQERGIPLKKTTAAQKLKMTSELFLLPHF